MTIATVVMSGWSWQLLSAVAVLAVLAAGLSGAISWAAKGGVVKRMVGAFAVAAIFAVVIGLTSAGTLAFYIPDRDCWWIYFC